MQVALVILDGWGLADHGRRDAIAAAATPNFDECVRRGASGRLAAAGRDVGLPDRTASNSEVGHVNIGAGRLVKQPYTRIDEAIETGEFAENEAIREAFEYAGEGDGCVHFLGVLSDGGVHSDMRHLFSLVELAAAADANAATHVFTDGRDAPPRKGVEYVRRFQEVVDEHGTGRAATVTGRFYAMDRGEDWDRTYRAYRAIVDRVADHRADSPVDAVLESYERGDTDEFVEPTLVRGGLPVRSGDSLVFFNFRSDRSRQLTRMIGNVDPVWEYDLEPPEVHVTTFTEYDERFEFPVAFPPLELRDTLGEVLEDHGLTQLRIAESQKYAHVTYFLNGGREIEFEGEIRRIIPSPDVSTFDRVPEMSASRVTDTAAEVVETDDPDVMILNYANPDMVGHTGDFDATIAAVEAVDRELGRLLGHLRERGAHVLLTSDHGTADDMGTEDDPHTAHTGNPVPFVYLAPDGTDGGMAVREGGSLQDVAPTMLALLGVEKPAAMTGESLLVES